MLNSEAADKQNQTNFGNFERQDSDVEGTDTHFRTGHAGPVLLSM